MAKNVGWMHINAKHIAHITVHILDNRHNILCGKEFIKIKSGRLLYDDDPLDIARAKSLGVDLSYPTCKACLRSNHKKHPSILCLKNKNQVSEYWCLYVQHRINAFDLWNESDRPEPYEIYPSKIVAEKAKKKLEDKCDPLRRWFIRKISKELAEFYA